MWENSTEESSEVIECTSLISNNFTLNSGGRNFTERRTQLRSLSVRRRQNAEPFLLSYDNVDTDIEDDVDDDDNDGNGNGNTGNRGGRRDFNQFARLYTETIKNVNDVDDVEIDDNDLIDDISFYGNLHSPQQQQQTRLSSIYGHSSSRSLRPFNDINNDDDDDTIGLLSPESSPKKFKVTSNMVTIIDNKKSHLITNNSTTIATTPNSAAIKNTHKYSSPKFNAIRSCFRKSPAPSSSSSLSPLGGANTIQTSSKLRRLDRHSNEQTGQQQNFKMSHSLSSTESSTESMDEDLYMDLYDTFDQQQQLQQNANEFPTNLKSLINGHIKSVKTNTTPEIKRPFLIRRCLSMQEDNKLKNCVRNQLFESPENVKRLENNDNNNKLTPTSSLSLFSSVVQQQNERCFKRPEPPTPTLSPMQIKRYKVENKENDIFVGSNGISSNKSSSRDNDTNTATITTATGTRSLLRKSMSMNDAQIMTALARSSSEPDLIGDFSKPFCLPLMEGRHRDLKSISCDTMAKLINGEYKESVASFKIIDCRYPYEYDGGHIRGAQNMYTHEQIVEELVNNKIKLPSLSSSPLVEKMTEGQQQQQQENDNNSTVVTLNDGPKRHILVFHCEFSSERGPKLSRFLRNHDRLTNSSKYPALHYPEIYLLHGGYKEFFEKYSQLCDPCSYRPMLDPSYGAAYKQFRAKSKSWNGGDTTITKFQSFYNTTNTSNNNLIQTSSNNNSNILGGRIRKSRSRLVL